MSKGAIFILIVCASFPALIIVALVVKQWEVRKAKRWPSTTGKVIASRIASSTKEPGDAASFGERNVTNEPYVEYEYHVEGQRFRNTRITIGEKTSEYELEAILARYPVGTAVTVYYDPANPQKAVLERDIFTSTMWLGFGCLMLFFIGGPLVAAFLYFNGLDWLRPHLANPKHAPFVTALTGFGLVVLLFAAAFTKMVWQAASWPIAPGRIISSNVESYLDDTDGPPRTQYRARVLYTYEVHGRQYTGDRLSLGLTISGTLSRLAQRTASRYPVGHSVDVYYNPDNPSDSLLHPHSRWHYLLWLIGIGILTFAWAVATGRVG
jgi:hypothetical protein